MPQRERGGRVAIKIHKRLPLHRPPASHATPVCQQLGNFKSRQGCLNTISGIRKALWDRTTAPSRFYKMIGTSRLPQTPILPNRVRCEGSEMVCLTKNRFQSTGSAPQSDMTQLPKKQFSTRWFVIFVMSDPSAFIVKMSALCGESPSKAIFFPSGE